MYYVIGADGKLHGPLSVVDVHQLLAEGRASKYSRVRRADEELWQPLSAVPELAPPAPAAPAAAAVHDRPADAPGSIAAEYLRQEGALDVGRCVIRGRDIVRANPLLLMATAGIVCTVLFAISQIPDRLVVSIVGMVVNSPMLGGLYYVYLRTMRGQRTSVEDVLAGFKQPFTPLLMSGLLTNGLASLAFMPAALLAAKLNIATALPATIGAAALAVGALVVLSIPGVYLVVSYVFVIPLIVDKRLHVWTAMEVSRRVVGRQWWTILALVMVAMLMILAGLLAFGIGVVIAAPVAAAAYLYAYEDLFVGG